MSRSRTLATALPLILVAAPAALLAAQQAQEATVIDVSGDWILTMEMGDADLTFTQEGATLTGVLESPQGALDLEGEVEGKEVVFWGYFDEFTIGFWAELDEDNMTMTGTMEAAEGEFVADFVAERKQ